jgi:hypothetical protein
VPWVIYIASLWECEGFPALQRRYRRQKMRTVALQRRCVHTVHTMRSRSRAPEQLSGSDLDSSVETTRVGRSRKGLPRRTYVQTVRAKQAFLTCYAEWANITHACKLSGVPRQNIYDWQEHDEDFARAFRIAESAATERLEREAWRRAVEGSPYERTSYWHGEPVGTDHKIEYSESVL